MTALEHFLKLDAWPAEWPDDYEPTLEDYQARDAAIAEAWTALTDEERAAARAWRVECAVCHRDYGRGISPTQANDCAAKIARGTDDQIYLTCHYGSDKDGDAYLLRASNLSSAPPLAEADPVCDDCVRAYDAAGMLVLLGDYLHDAGVARKVFGEGSLHAK